MSPTLSKSPQRFVQDVPAFGLIGDAAVASTGHLWPAARMHYSLVAYTDVATVRLGKHFSSAPNRMTAASGRPVLDINEFILPTIDASRHLRQEENIARKSTQEDGARRHIDTFLTEVYRCKK